MKTIVFGLAGVLAVAACGAPAPTPTAASTQPAPAPVVHTVIPAKDVKWSQAPASIPPGAQVSLLHGDPTKPEMFVMRLKLPKGYAIPPHRHPANEIVTVVSGTFRLGQGEVADRSMAQALPPGSFFAFSPGMAHYAFADTDTVVQISTMGPWGLSYVNAADDPRNKK